MHDVREEFTKSVCIFVFFFAFAEAARQMAVRLFCSFVLLRSFYSLSLVFTQAADFIFILICIAVAIGITSDPGTHLEMARKSCVSRR